MHQDEEALAYGTVMDQLWQDAVSQDEARRLILSAIDRLRAGEGP